MTPNVRIIRSVQQTNVSARTDTDHPLLRVPKTLNQLNAWPSDAPLPQIVNQSIMFAVKTDVFVWQTTSTPTRPAVTSLVQQVVSRVEIKQMKDHPRVHRTMTPLARVSIKY